MTVQTSEKRMVRGWSVNERLVLYEEEKAYEYKLGYDACLMVSTKIQNQQMNTSLWSVGDVEGNSAEATHVVAYLSSGFQWCCDASACLLGSYRIRFSTHFSLHEILHFATLFLSECTEKSCRRAEE